MEEHDSLNITALRGMPLFAPGTAVAAEIASAAARSGQEIRSGDLVTDYIQGFLDIARASPARAAGPEAALAS